MHHSFFSIRILETRHAFDWSYKLPQFLFVIEKSLSTYQVYYTILLLYRFWIHFQSHLLSSEKASKSGQVENSEKLEISKSSEIFSEIFKSEFSILAIGQNRKLGNKKSRNNIYEISEISEVSEFSIWHFFIFQKTFFFQFSTVSNSVLSIYVMFCFQGLLKCFFLHQKYMFKILPRHNEIHLLWDLSTLMRTWGMLIWMVLTFPILNVMKTIKIWSKWKLSEVSKFSISSLGQNRKLGNLGIGYFSFSDHIIKLTFFILGHFSVSF